MVKNNKQRVSLSCQLSYGCWWWFKLFLVVSFVVCGDHPLLTSSLAQEASSSSSASLGVEEELTDSVANVKMEENSESTTTTTRPPNILLLFMDDLGYGDVGFNGHPTTSTPNLDKLAHGGKILTSWYSGCHICSGSRAALMTGRQFPRFGMPGVLGPEVNIGLPLEEVTIAEQLQQRANYTTCAIGKWHLGQRPIYLPGNRGFDYYLGIPYSDDMGYGQASTCPSNATDQNQDKNVNDQDEEKEETEKRHASQLPPHQSSSSTTTTTSSSTTHPTTVDWSNNFLPLVLQRHNVTRVLEQPVDFTSLILKYNQFALDFIEEQQQQGSSSKTNEDKNHNNNNENPFFLYVPFSHVHTTRENMPESQYASCQFQNTTRRGKFGDALAEADWMVGNIVSKLEELDIANDTLIIFTSDNGPWMAQGLSAGSTGLFIGRYSGYWNTGKGSTWEGGIRMPAFAYWPNHIKPYTRSSEIVSSMDIFPTLSKLAGIDELPVNRTYDGRDMSNILLDQGGGQSSHDFLFFYGSCNNLANQSKNDIWSVTAVRHQNYKAHWCTAPGLEPRTGWNHNRSDVRWYHKYPLLFDIDQDPSESIPLNPPGNVLPTRPNHADAMKRILKAYAMEIATFEFGTLRPYPDGPGEIPGHYEICCDRSRQCDCNSTRPSNDGKDHDASGNVNTTTAMHLVRGIFNNVGSKQHHDKYHNVLGEEEPYPPQTLAHKRLLQQHQQWQ